MPSSPHRRALLSAALLLAVVALAFLTQMLPRLDRHEATSAGTPVPFGTRAQADIALAPGSEACEPHITIDAAAGTATIATRPPGRRPTPQLLLTLSGPGYRERVRLAGGATVAQQVSARIASPARSLVGTACVRNMGAVPVIVSGSGDPRVLTRTRATLDGRQQAAAFILTFQESASHGVLADLPDMIDRAATFSAAGPWLFWLLLPLLVLGVPLAVAVALLLALRSPDAPEPDDG